MLSRSWIGIIGLAMIVSTLPGSVSAAGQRVCVVDRIDGPDARYWVSGAWSNLAVGFAVPVDAKIATGAETRVRIACDDDTVVIIGTETELNLENLVAAVEAGRPVAMQLIEGVIGLFVPKRDRAGLEVRTPVAIASVRSTEFLVEWSQSTAAAVFVRRGEVVVRGEHGRRFVLGDGEGITVTAAGVPGEVKTWGQARIATSTERLGFDWR